MKDTFQQILLELSQSLHITLHSDKLGSCSLLMPSGLIIQMQLDAAQEYFIFFSKLGELLPGKFRENVLRESLKTNGMDDPRAGILGYFPPTNHLVLFQSYPITILNSDILAKLFNCFDEMAQTWTTAIQNGQISPVEPSQTKIPFGLPRP